LFTSAWLKLRLVITFSFCVLVVLMSPFFFSTSNQVSAKSYHPTSDNLLHSSSKDIALKGSPPRPKLKVHSMSGVSIYDVGPATYFLGCGTGWSSMIDDYWVTFNYAYTTGSQACSKAVWDDHAHTLGPFVRCAGLHPYNRCGS
jgi:hypothetical protein